MRPLLSSALLLTLAACDTGRANLSYDPADLVGTWDLVSLTYADPTRTVSPTWTESYTFRADGTATRVYDGESEVTTWEVRRLAGLADGVPLLHIGERRSEWFWIDGDRLYFEDRPADGPLSEYARR